MSVLFVSALGTTRKEYEDFLWVFWYELFSLTESQCEVIRYEHFKTTLKKIKLNKS